VTSRDRLTSQESTMTMGGPSVRGVLNGCRGEVIGLSLTRPLLITREGEPGEGVNARECLSGWRGLYQSSPASSRG